MPHTEADHKFRNALVQELIFAWKQAGPAGKAALAQVLFNVGIEFRSGEWVVATCNGFFQEG